MARGKANYDKCQLKNPITQLVFRAAGSAIWSAPDAGVDTSNFKLGYVGALKCPRTRIYEQQTPAYASDRRARREIRKTIGGTLCKDCSFCAMTPLDFKEHQVRETALETVLIKAKMELLEAQQEHAALTRELGMEALAADRANTNDQSGILDGRHGDVTGDTIVIHHGALQSDGEATMAIRIPADQAAARQ